MEKLDKYLNRYDKFLIISILLLGILGVLFSAVFFKERAEMVIIIRDAGGKVKRIPLRNTYGEEPFLIPVDGPIGISIVEAYNGRVRMKKAPERDPEMVCEKTGWIDQPGPMIICVPNQIAIWIEKKDAELDGISW
ncbi:MAG: NusG domain II-containing protein [Halanaerobiaceae bacterium]|nr:NusG domain II-containing protein [Halanaerobiaceae bacterium]